MNKKLVLILVVAVLAMTFGIFARKSVQTTRNFHQNLDFTFATPDGKPVKLSDWKGKVVVLNFWATWCPPCKEEMPAFSAVNSKLSDKSVQFAGIGIDTPDNIRQFQKTTPISYPLFIAGYDTLRLTADIGNQSLSLPFTIILDDKGRLVFTHQGKLDEAALLQQLSPLLADKK